MTNNKEELIDEYNKYKNLIIDLNKEEHQLQKNYDKNKKSLEKLHASKQKIRKELIKSIIFTILISLSIIVGTNLAVRTLPIQNIVGIILIVSGFNVGLFNIKTKKDCDMVTTTNEELIELELNFEEKQLQNLSLRLNYYNNSISYIEKNLSADNFKPNFKKEKEESNNDKNIEKINKSFTRIRN